MKRMKRVGQPPRANKYIAMKAYMLAKEEEAGYDYERLTIGEKQQRLSKLLRFGVINHDEFLRRLSK